MHEVICLFLWFYFAAMAAICISVTAAPYVMRAVKRIIGLAAQRFSYRARSRYRKALALRYINRKKDPQYRIKVR